MTDKEKYINLMQRYWEAETTPEEERDLAWYAAQTEDPDFDVLRGVLGCLSIGRGRQTRRRVAQRRLTLSLAAGLATVAVIWLAVSTRDLCFSNSYGERIQDKEEVMADVEASLTDFFNR